MSPKNDRNEGALAISVHIHLRLRPGEDDDLIKFFNRQGICVKRVRSKRLCAWADFRQMTPSS
ncbi:hypothetical protein SDC9_108476 [bioreactor metagenome]|uniref:Uncharacterized protein n=1 Tax=bioreactor metagenome TaxID=1076179 RepID=A0A645B990_9ZZZZ